MDIKKLLLLQKRRVATIVSPLLTDLAAFWKLEEASGSRLDSVGSNTLTDVNTVTQAAGILGNAAQFLIANSEYLSIADNAAIGMGDNDFTITCWLKLGVNNVGMGIVAKDAATKRDYALTFESPGSGSRFRFEVCNGVSTSIGTARATSFGLPATDTWIFVVVWHDSVNNTVNIQVNNGTINSAATSGAAGRGTADLRIGSQQVNPFYYTGLIDEVGIWKRILTTNEKSQLYANGVGITHPF